MITYTYVRTIVVNGMDFIVHQTDTTGSYRISDDDDNVLFHTPTGVSLDMVEDFIETWMWGYNRGIVAGEKQFARNVVALFGM